MSSRWKKTFILIAIAVLVGLFIIFDLQRYLTLAHLKAQQETLQGYYASHRLLTLAAYFCFYIIVTALSLPGAAVMTLAGKDKILGTIHSYPTLAEANKAAALRSPLITDDESTTCFPIRLQNERSSHVR